MLFAAAAIVTAEVLGRKFLPSLSEGLIWLIERVSPGNSALNEAIDAWSKTLVFSGSDELSSYLFAVGTTWSMAYVLCTRGHIRIDALYGTLSPKIRGWLDLLALLALGIFVAAMVERAWDVTWTNFIETNRSNTNLRIPLAFPQFPWFAGILLFAVAIVLAFLRTLFALLRGDYQTARDTAGVATMDEEIESEMASLGLGKQHGGQS
ncbi:MAG: TRAP transporter small permease [Hyphomicrobiaceae bacterium]